MRKFLCAWDALIFHTTCALRAEISRLYLHFVWWFLDPLLTLLTLYIVFGIFLASVQAHFIIFLGCGIVTWQWFGTTVNNATPSIFISMHRCQQFKINPVHFPLCVFLQDFAKYLPVLLIFLLGLALFSPHPPSRVWLCLIPVIMVEGLCVLGVSIMIASLVPFLPDLARAVPLMVNMLFFASGIFFDINSTVLPRYQAIMYLNPNAVCITAMREILIKGQMPDWTQLGQAALISLLALIIGLVMVSKFSKIYSRLVSQ